MTSEGVFACLVRIYPAAYRAADATEMREDFAEHLLEARREGRKGVLRLWLRAVPDQFIGIGGAWGSVLGRQVGAFAVPHRLAVLCGIAAIVAGVGLMADGVMVWISMALFFQHPGFPAEASLGFLENRFLTALLTVAACGGLLLVTGLRSGLARCGAGVAGLWAVLTLFLAAYDSLGGTGAGLVTRFASLVVQIEPWAIALAAFLLAGASFASRELRGWGALLLVVCFVHSPLMSEFVVFFWQRSLEYSVGLQGSFETLLMLQRLRGFVYHAAFILPGMSWAILGCLMLAKSRNLRPGLPTPVERSTHPGPQSRAEVDGRRERRTKHIRQDPNLNAGS